MRPSINPYRLVARLRAMRDARQKDFESEKKFDGGPHDDAEHRAYMRQLASEVTLIGQVIEAVELSEDS